MMANKVVAVIPAYNAVKTMDQLVRRSKKFADRVVVVDDGSQDETARAAKSAGAVVVRLEKNSGKASAIRRGVAEALKKKVDVIVLLDADLQHLPEEIPRVVRPVASGKCDICIGSRFLGDYGTMPIHRRLTNTLVTLATNLFTGYRLTDVQCGFRALGKKAVSVLDFEGDRYTIEPNMVLEAREKKLTICEVPIRTIYGDSVSYIRSGGHTIALAKMFAKRAVKKKRR